MTCLTSDLYGTIPEVPTGGSSIYQGQYVGGGAAANQSAGAAMIRSGRKSPKSRSGPKAQDSFAESCPGSDDGNVTNPVEVSTLTTEQLFCHIFIYWKRLWENKALKLTWELMF